MRISNAAEETAASADMPLGTGKLTASPGFPSTAFGVEGPKLVVFTGKGMFLSNTKNDVARRVEGLVKLMQLLLWSACTFQQRLATA